MLTSDPIYYKPLLPAIRIKTTDDSTDTYVYSAFTGNVTTGPINIFPIYCSVTLSQNTHGAFTIQFDDPSRQMEQQSIATVGSRVRISCGKQSTATTRLISGLVRKKGYTRGSDNRLLYTISGSSTSIRLNEIIRYVVSEASKLSDGITPNTADASRKADTLLATNLADLTSDGILSIAGLAANSDVETFIANLSIEFGQLQDIVNYIEEQSGGMVVVDTNDLVNLRYQIKNTLSGRGFTIKNKNPSVASSTTDDADDTMYLRGKNWDYEDDFYVSSNYANRITAIMRADPRPGQPVDLGFVENNSFTVLPDTEYALKFRPTHTRFTPGDVYVVGGLYSTGTPDLVPSTVTLRVCKDAGGVPRNTDGIVGTISYFQTNFGDPIPTFSKDVMNLINDAWLYDRYLGQPGDFYLDTTKNYWLIFTHEGFYHVSIRFAVGQDMRAVGITPDLLGHSANFSTASNGGSGWASFPGPVLPCFGVGRYRAEAYTIWDPKGMLAVSSGVSGGQMVNTMVTESAVQITSRESMVRHLASVLNDKVKPTTSYNFPRVLAPNIPPFPGDPIVISDSVLGLSTSGNQVTLTACGDMTYTWGNMGSGSYEAPTILNINAVGVHSRYR